MKAVVLAALLVAACGPSVTSGEVVAKRDVPAHDWTYLQPHTICVGKPQVCTTYFTPIPMHDPERFVVTLRDCSADPCREGDVNVSREQFEAAAIGDDVVTK